jgi:hypothetical protein
MTDTNAPATTTEIHECPEGTWYLSEHGDIWAVHPDQTTHIV